VTGHCTSVLHGTLGLLRPAAVYRLLAEPCHSAQCEGRICCGHPLCPECVAAIRVGRVRWADSGEDVEVVLVVSA
jgi:hypothetical protein